MRLCYNIDLMWCLTVIKTQIITGKNESYIAKEIPKIPFSPSETPICSKLVNVFVHHWLNFTGSFKGHYCSWGAKWMCFISAWAYVMNAFMQPLITCLRHIVVLEKYSKYLGYLKDNNDNRKANHYFFILLAHFDASVEWLFLPFYATETRTR